MRLKEDSKSREEAMMTKIERMGDVESALYRELKENKDKSLHLELMVVTLVCFGISLTTFISLRRR